MKNLYLAGTFLICYPQIIMADVSLIPDLTQYKTITNQDIFSTTTNYGKGFINLGGTTYYYTNLPATNNRIDGGAYASSQTNDFIENYAPQQTYVPHQINIYGGALGGAMRINGGGNLAGNFIRNEVPYNTDWTENSGGGAIYNTGTVTSINANFLGNSVVANYGYGGAIYNDGTITDITGDFIGNKLQAYYGGAGGAIYNTKDHTIGTITGKFVGNSANLYGYGTAFTSGGAIYNAGTISAIAGDFINNSVQSIYGASGGAIYNYGGSIGALTGNFMGNSSSSGGGAIVNVSYTSEEYDSGTDTWSTVDHIGIINLVGTVNFMTSSDTIANNGIISTIGGTELSPTQLHLQSVSGNGEFNLNDYTVAYLEDGQQLTQNELNISQNSILNMSASGLNAQVVNNDGVLNLGAGTLNKDISGNGITNLSNVIIASNHITIQNGVTNIDGVLQLNISNLSENSSDYVGGNLSVIGDLNINPNSELRLVITPSLLANNHSTGELELISVSGAQNGDFDTLSANNMYAISKQGNKYVITQQSSIGDIISTAESGDANFVNAANAWNTAVFNTGTLQYDIQYLLSYLAQYDAEGYVEALDNIVPADVNVADISFRNINTGIIKQFSERFSSLKVEGRSGGDSAQAKFNIWAQGLFNKSEQTGKSKFDADASGITFGAETIFDDKLMLAAGYTYGKNDVKSGAKKLDGNMSIFSLFAEYDMDKLYVNGGLSYGMASYEQTTKYKNTAEFDANTISMNAGVGYNFGKYTSEFRMIYTNTSVDKYKDAIGQEIQYDDNSALSFVTSVKYKDSFKMQSSTLTPEISFGIIYDVVSDDSVAKVDLGTAQYMVYGEKINPFGLNLGIGTGVDVANWNFAVGYDLEWRNNFISHTGKVKAKYMF